MTGKRLGLAAMLAALAFSLSGCFIQPDPTLDPLVITDGEGTIPFGTVQSLPTPTPSPTRGSRTSPPCAPSFLKPWPARPQ